MEQRTCKRMLTSVLIVLLMLTALDMTRTSGNPIPSDLVDESKGGGSPAPSAAFDNVYFSKEWVFADIENTSARVLAHYTFRNIGNEDVVLPILLPFHDRAWDIEVLQGDVPLEFTEYDAQDHALNYYNEMLDHYLRNADWIGFNLSVPSGTSTMVSVRYSSIVAIYTFSLYHHTWIFSYLVGSACLWNHSLDHAFFEFRMSDAFFDEDYEHWTFDGWERKKMDGHWLFTKEFYDWVPDEYLILLMWEHSLSSSDPSSSFFHTLWFWALVIVVPASIVIGTFLVLFLWFKIKRARSNRGI